ncbi:MAG: DUF3482 domain-containing protein [Moraxella sp.]|nr:DUF3482 domain-containing protein [Moraxella sp.]
MNKNNNLINIAVIGHTNVGKTSLMRTLTRNQVFGEIKNSSATTRHVEAVRLDIGTVSLMLFDTPGLEDASGVMDYLLDHTDNRSDGVVRLADFVQAVTDNSPLTSDHTQEAKVIKALMNADLALYVIDVREPVLSKYQDELAIVAWAGVPVLPVFNFMRDSDNLAAWRNMLGKRGLHIVSLFDTVAYDFANEIKLWQNLATLSDNSLFDKLINARQDNWQQLLEKGKYLIADFLVNVAAISIKINENEDTAAHLDNIQNRVRQAERLMQDSLLTLYKFYNHPINLDPLHITASTSNPFDSSQLTHYGIRTATGGTAGAIIGAGIDVAALGATFGLGTVVGGIIGGAIGNANTLKDKVMGLKSLNIDDSSLLVLASRACQLHSNLRHIGHALQSDISSDSGTQTTAWQADKMPKILKEVRHKPHYSSILQGDDTKAEALRSPLSTALGAVLPPNE